MTMRFLALLLLIAGSASAQLFREDASNNRLVMDSGHLQEWDFPVGTLDFEGGTVRPKFVRKNMRLRTKPLGVDLCVVTWNKKRIF